MINVNYLKLFIQPVNALKCTQRILPIINISWKKPLPYNTSYMQLHGNHTLTKCSLTCWKFSQTQKLLDGQHYFGAEIINQQRGYAMRLELSEYGITWKRPESVPEYKPEKAGDLVPFEKLDMNKPVLEMSNIAEEISKSDERAQRLLSLEFSSEKDVILMAKHKFKRKVQRHQFDDDSLEVKIATITAYIRYLQTIVTPNKKLMKKRIKLQEMVTGRKKMLKKLRKEDYKKFEWILEELSLFYKPEPPVLTKITRRESLRKLVELHCQELINRKMEKYHQELEPLKGPFLKEKRETLAWIAETEKWLGLPVSVQIPDEEDDKKLLESGVPFMVQLKEITKE